MANDPLEVQNQQLSQLAGISGILVQSKQGLWKENRVC